MPRPSVVQAPPITERIADSRAEELWAQILSRDPVEIRWYYSLDYREVSLDMLLRAILPSGGALDDVHAGRASPSGSSAGEVRGGGGDRLPNVTPPPTAAGGVA